MKQKIDGILAEMEGHVSGKIIHSRKEIVQEKTTDPRRQQIIKRVILPNIVGVYVYN